MKTTSALSLAAILFLLIAPVGHAGPASGGSQVDSSAGASAVTSAVTSAAEKATLSEVRDRAETMPVDRRNDIDKRIRITVERVNKEAAAKGQTTVAARLAAEFGMTVEGLLDEKGDHGLTWGDLVIAHTLLAYSNATVALPDLVSLRSDGLSWGAVAYGLRFHLEDLENAIKAEGRVAMGLSKTDGRTAPPGK